MSVSCEFFVCCQV